MDHLQEYLKKEEENRKLACERLVAICHKLLPMGIQRIEVEYDGCGDSGAVENVTFFSGENEYTAELPSIPSENNKNEIPVKEAVEDIAYYFLPDGWEINDGSYGTLIIDVTKKTATRQHNNRYTDTDYSEEEFTL